MTSPDPRAALADEAQKCALYDFDTVEMVECKWALWEKILAALRSPFPYSGATGDGPFSTKVAAEASLTLAITHIEHMASWIAKQNAGYSFESLGEDMPCIKSALEASLATTLPRDAERETIERLAGLDERLDRLCLLATDNNRFVLSTESAKNIVEIVREWLRRPSIPPREGPLQSTTEQADASRDHPVSGYSYRRIYDEMQRGKVSADDGAKS